MVRCLDADGRVQRRHVQCNRLNQLGERKQPGTEHSTFHGSAWAWAKIGDVQPQTLPLYPFVPYGTFLGVALVQKLYRSRAEGALSREMIAIDTLRTFHHLISTFEAKKDETIEMSMDRS